MRRTPSADLATEDFQ